MALISIILSLLTDRYLGSLREFRNYGWFEGFTDRFRELIPELARRPLVAVVLLLALPAVAVLVTGWVLGSLWSLLGFAFALALLLYSFGCQDLEPQIEAFIDARLRGDDEAARWHLSAVLQGQVPDDPRQLTRSLIETVLVELNDRLLAVIFWFALFGPAGALVFRLSSLLRQRFAEEPTGFGAAVHKVYHVLAWAPARLTALGYSLAGSWEESMLYRREEAPKWRDENRGILIASGLGALQYALSPTETPTREREIIDLRAAIGLVRRTLMMWLAVLAIMVLVGTVVSLQLESL